MKETSVSSAKVRIHVASSGQKETCLRGRKGVVKRESGVKKGERSGECVRVKEGREIEGVKGNRATKNWGNYGVTVRRGIEIRE